MKKSIIILNILSMLLIAWFVISFFDVNFNNDIINGTGPKLDWNAFVIMFKW